MAGEAGLVGGSGPATCALALALWVAACGAPGRSGPPSGVEDAPGATQGAVEPMGARQALGRRLYLRHCAACHGANGEGQPDWAVPLADGSLPAPPHDNTGHTWHHSDAELLRIIAEGGTWYSATSRMPAFGQQLSVAEQGAILDHIKSWWGPKERAWQAERTQEWAELVARATASARP